MAKWLSHWRTLPPSKREYIMSKTKEKSPFGYDHSRSISIHNLLESRVLGWREL